MVEDDELRRVAETTRLCFREAEAAASELARCLQNVAEEVGDALKPFVEQIEGQVEKRHSRQRFRENGKHRW